MSRVRQREYRVEDGRRVVIRSAAPGDALGLVAIKKSVVEEGDWTLVQAEGGSYIDSVLMYRFVVE